tara:strand:- start:7218 stop:8723 length:1506 start_codon:yes stop_codon:yes gene_type:complete
LNYYLTIDAGTSIVKVVIFNLKFKAVFIQTIKNNVITDSKGKSEINMDQFWQNTSNCIKECIKKSNINPKSILGVGLTGNMVGAWPIDHTNKPFRNAILWNDTRSEKVFELLKKNKSKIFEEIYKISGSIVQYGCTLPVLKWFDIFEKKTIIRTKYFLTCKDWIRYKLTNTFNNDYTERAVSPGDIKKIKFSKKIFKLLNLDFSYANKFPEVKKSDEIGGYITNLASKKTGLKIGTPVVIGAGDVPSSAIGVGAIKNGMCSTIVGTTCHNYLVSSKPLFKPLNAGLLFYSPNNQWLRTMINVAGTTNFDWVIENFFKDKISFQSKKEIIKNFEKKFKKNNIKNNQIIFLPYFNYGGSISPFFNLNTKGEIFGLQPHHSGEDILLASYQGLAMSIKDCYDALEIKLNKLFLSGGASRSNLFPQILADVLKTKIYIPEGEEFGARGAAYLTSVAIKRNKNLSSALKINQKIKKKYYPNIKNYHYYSLKFGKFLKLRKQLNNIW